MKNFETLYKLLMNESEEEMELSTAEMDLATSETASVEDPSTANPRNAKIKNILKLAPKLTEQEAGKIVDADLYDVFISQFPEGAEDEAGPDVSGLEISPEDELPTDDDISDIREPLSIERKSRAEEDEDMWNLYDQD